MARRRFVATKGQHVWGGLVAAAVLASCLVDFDDLDPRLGDATGGGGMGATGGGTAPGGTGGTGAMGGTGGTGAVGGAAGAGGEEPGGGGSGGSAPTVLEYTAAVADCIYLDVNPPSPDTCAFDTGDDSFTVDEEVTPPNPGHVSHGFLRFDLDGQLSGLTVTAVRLELTANSLAGADGPSSGQIWSCAPFDRTDLFVAAPATSTMLSPDVGAVAVGATVSFTLPITPASGDSVYLSVVPNNTNGIDYLNTAGAKPPKLLITAQ